MVKQVAIYLRKSRDNNETTDTLSKHRDTLVSIANSNDWDYELYEEIASGERLSYRPVAQDLLEHVESGEYDAVLVMDIDRLGRGNNKDWGIIYEAFCNNHNNTLIVTPQRTYDLTEDTDEMMVDFQSLFAKMEYKAIRKRLMRGKVAGAKQGLWTCGNPPYPYVITNKILSIDNEKLPVYRMMVDRCIAGDSLEEITIMLNSNSIPSPKGTQWASSTVKRLLCDEVHLGHMIYGRTKGDSRKSTFTKIPRDQWVKVVNAHPAVKSIEEHNEILTQIASRRTIPVAARKRVHALSGLLYCGDCGYRMVFKMSGSGYYCAICNHKLHNGTRCMMKGHKLSKAFFDALYDTVFKVDNDKLRDIAENDKYQGDTAVLIAECNKEITKADMALQRIFDVYESGDISKPEFVKRKTAKEKQKQQIITRLTELQATVKPRLSVDDYIANIEKMKDLWDNAMTDQEKNKILHGFIQRIDYYRDSDGITLNITVK